MWRFVKRDRLGNPAVVTEYASSDELADQVLEGLRKFDFLAIRFCGYTWDKVPADEQISSNLPKTKDWDSPAMNGEPLPIAGRPSDETYLRRMATKGVDEEEALRLRRFIDSLS